MGASAARGLLHGTLFMLMRLSGRASTLADAAGDDGCDAEVWQAAEEIPPEWHGGDLGELEGLVEMLLSRQGRIRALIRGVWTVGSRAVP